MSGPQSILVLEVSRLTGFGWDEVLRAASRPLTYLSIQTSDARIRRPHIAVRSLTNPLLAEHRPPTQVYSLPLLCPLPAVPLCLALLSNLHSTPPRTSEYKRKTE